MKVRASAHLFAAALVFGATIAAGAPGPALAGPPITGPIPTPLQPIVRETPILAATAPPSVVDVALSFDPAVLRQLEPNFTPLGICRSLQLLVSTNGLSSDPYFERIQPLSLDVAVGGGVERDPRCIGTYTMKPNSIGRYASVTSLRVLECFLTNSFPAIAVTPNLVNAGANSVPIDPGTRVPTIEQTIVAQSEAVAGAWNVSNCGYAF